MTFPPHDFWGWMILLLQAVFLLVPPGVIFFRLFSVIGRHWVCFSGQRIFASDPEKITYRFAIQNNEHVALPGRRTLTIRFEEPSGKFLEFSNPRVYAGCNAIRVRIDKERNVWTMSFDELPAYETWTIECETNRDAQNVKMSLSEADPADSDTPGLSHNELTLPADRNSVFVGRQTTPEAAWAATSVAFSLGGFCAVYYVVLCGLNPQSLATEAMWEDLVWPVSIVAFGMALWRVTRRPAPSVSQGYWSPSDVTEENL